MTLLESVQAATKSKSSSGSKTPADYTRERNRLVGALINHENPVVRGAVLGHIDCPATHVNLALENEKDKDVLRSILMGTKASLKAIEKFSASSAASQFDDDSEVQLHIIARLSGSTPPVGQPNPEGEDGVDVSTLLEELEEDEV